ncbi:hypothetical protein BDY24DRAFT_394829 [Mrakia frigida]|uniref:uncharacterized protein n=1 Tax=Mrakia frigida TaxID=29902 RepID=UPI003FCBF044
MWKELSGLIWDGMRKSSTAEILLAVVPGASTASGASGGGGAGGGRSGGANGGAGSRPSEMESRPSSHQRNGAQTHQPSPVSSSSANQRQHPLNVYLNPSPNHTNQHLSPPQPYGHSPSSSTASPSGAFPIPNMYHNPHPSSQPQQHSGLPSSSSSQPFPLPFALSQSNVPSQLQHPLQNFQHHQPNQPNLQYLQHHQQQLQPPAQGALEFSYETVVNEEDLWAGLGNTEGYSWMGLGFDGDVAGGGLGGGAGGAGGGGDARF